MAKPNIPIPALTEKDKQRFYLKISKVPTERGCLEWTAYKDKGGYGIVGIKRKVLLAHRVAYFAITGRDPADLHVCHRCDNPSCVNFEHFFLGTHSSNMRDKVSKGRGNFLTGDKHWSRNKTARLARGDNNGARTKPEKLVRGEKHLSAKLKEADVVLIRSDTRSNRDLSNIFGVHIGTIQKIKARQTWKHI